MHDMNSTGCPGESGTGSSVHDMRSPRSPQESATAVMPAATLKALKASIAHWRRMAEGKQKAGEGPFCEHCALCARFQTRKLALTPCVGCPVMARTGQAYCHRTPYYAARSDYYDYEIDSPQFRASAAKELAFLESLLPEGA